MADWIKVTGIEDVEAISDWVGRMDTIFYEPKVFTPIIWAIGRGVERFFESEVTPLGRSWQPLSPFTQKVRMDRGYSGARPILEQSGQLRDLASRAFLTYRGGAGIRRSATAPYGNYEPLSLSATYVNGYFSATISGTRVQNQYGQRINYGKFRLGSKGRDRWNTIPSRPFWGLTQDMFDWGIPRMMTAFAIEWQRQLPPGL